MSVAFVASGKMSADNLQAWDVGQRAAIRFTNLASDPFSDRCHCRSWPTG